ncbi:MAG: riboflavin synthase [Candidatus Omnitrophota bacterium]|jgi:riboflavin synthase
MFTGIIKELGKVEKIARSSSLIKIGASSKSVYDEANISDSVSINGVCLTVTGKKNNILFFDVVKSTLDKTNLKRLKIKEVINLEPALKLGEKLGGHFVLGHVDSEGKLKRISRKTDFWQLEVELPKAFRRYMVENGSVALNGISLTVKKIMSFSFVVDIIPFTYENTNLKYKRVGDWLNIEFDYLLKNRS